MTTPELTKWLRENSSGAYRPAAEAADLIEVLQNRLEWTTSILNHGAIPEPAHQGPCGPEAGCDCLCMETAHFYGTLTEINRFLQANAKCPSTGALGFFRLPNADVLAPASEKTPTK